jgi:PAS domain S-box-containing protein
VSPPRTTASKSEQKNEEPEETPHEKLPHKVSAEPAASSAAQGKEAHHEGADLYDLVNRLPGAVYRCTYDTAWKSIYMGEGFKQICDLDPQSLDPAGRSFKEVVHPDDLDRIREAVGMAVKKHSYYRVEYRIQSDDGKTRWVQDNGRPSFNDDGSVRWLDGILLDVTKRKQAQQDLLQAEAQVEARVEARTMKVRELSDALTLAEQRERSQIATSVHDELLQFLYGLQVQVRMLIDGIQEQSAVDPTVLPVSPERIDELMDEAIDAARRFTIDLAPPVLENDGIIEALQWLRTDLKKQHDFSVHLRNETKNISCASEVRTVLFRVTRELLLNACKYADVKSARVHAYAENQTLCIDVIDEGVGFDPDVALRRNSAGSGLWKAREHLRSIDGTLRITAAPGDGTHCSVQVPVEALDCLESDSGAPM